MQVLQEAGVIASAVADGRDLVEDPHLEARGFWARSANADVPFMPYPGISIKLSDTPVTFRYPPPALGEHNDEVYTEVAGLSPGELAQLREERIVVDVPPASLEELTASKSISRPYG